MLKKIIIVLAIILIAGLFYWRNLNSPADSGGSARIFLVNQGENVMQVAENLRQDNLIKSAFYFKYIARRGRLSIKAGEYTISPSMTTSEISERLTSGEALSQEKQIRIVEGWNIKDINDYLNKNKIVPENTFISIAKQEIRNLKSEIKLSGELTNDLLETASLEGFLFRDTYRIFKMSTAEGIILKMLSNFGKKLTPEMRAEIKRRNKTIYEIVTMASIIEKEVRTPADMKIVAGVFWNRIKYGMPLQSDASLSYILDDKVGAHTINDLKIDSPYNTYKYPGLPPGPIANPGLNAIQAAIYPVYTEYNYFLSDPKTGATIF